MNPHGPPQVSPGPGHCRAHPQLRGLNTSHRSCTFWQLPPHCPGPVKKQPTPLSKQLHEFGPVARQIWVPGHAPLHWPPESGGPQDTGIVVVVVDVVVVVTGASGAQSSVAVRGVTVRLPNWSVALSAGSAVDGHLTL